MKYNPMLCLNVTTGPSDNHAVLNEWRALNPPCKKRPFVCCREFGYCDVISLDPALPK